VVILLQKPVMHSSEISVVQEPWKTQNQLFLQDHCEEEYSLVLNPCGQFSGHAKTKILQQSIQLSRGLLILGMEYLLLRDMIQVIHHCNIRRLYKHCWKNGVHLVVQQHLDVWFSAYSWFLSWGVELRVQDSFRINSRKFALLLLFYSLWGYRSLRIQVHKNLYQVLSSDSEWTHQLV